METVSFSSKTIRQTNSTLPSQTECLKCFYNITWLSEMVNYGLEGPHKMSNWKQPILIHNKAEKRYASI